MLILDPFYIAANALGDAACAAQLIAKLRYRNTETSSKISVTSYPANKCILQYSLVHSSLD